MQVIETAPSITVLTPPNDGSHLLSLAGPASKTERVSKGIRLIRKEGQSPYEAPHIIPALAAAREVTAHACAPRRMVPFSGTGAVPDAGPWPALRSMLPKAVSHLQYRSPRTLFTGIGDQVDAGAGIATEGTAEWKPALSLGQAGHKVSSTHSSRLFRTSHVADVW
jgi:hypothetical protein